MLDKKSLTLNPPIVRAYMAHSSWLSNCLKYTRAMKMKPLAIPQVFYRLIHNLFSKLMRNHLFLSYFSCESFKILKVCALCRNRGRNIFLIHKNLLQWAFLPASVGKFTAHSASRLIRHLACCTKSSRAHPTRERAIEA